MGGSQKASKNYRAGPALARRAGLDRKEGARHPPPRVAGGWGKDWSLRVEAGGGMAKPPRPGPC